MKKHFLCQTVICLAGTTMSLPFTAISIERAESKKNSMLHNVVVLLAGDQGYADVSYHEHPDGISTPAFVQLAKSSVVFTNLSARVTGNSFKTRKANLNFTISKPK